MNVLVLSTGIRDPDNAISTMVVAGLQAAGQTVCGFDPYLSIGALGQSGAQRLLRQTVTARRIDWILCFPPYDLIEPATSAFLRSRHIPVVGLRYDDAVIFTVFANRQLRRDEILLTGYAQCDLIATTCVAAHDRAQALGADRMAFWTLPISSERYPVLPGPAHYDVSFVGSAMTDQPTASPRLVQVQGLLAAGLDVRVWGSGWQAVAGLPAESVGGRLDFEGMLAVFRQSRLSLTPPGNYAPDPLPMVKFRNLEVASVGGVQVQQRCADVDAHFVPGEEYLAYDDVAELPQLVAHALEQPDRLRRMGERAARRIRQDHDWRRRVPEILAALRDRGFALAEQPVAPLDPVATAPLAVAAIALGHLCEAASRPAYARSYFDEMLVYEPDNRAALAGLARLAGQGGDRIATTVQPAWEAALRTLGHAVDCGRETAWPDADAMAPLAHAAILVAHHLEHRGCDREAQSYYEQVLRYAAADSAALAGLARLAEKAGVPVPPAVQAWDRVTAVQPALRYDHTLRRIIPGPAYGTHVSTDLATEAAVRRFTLFESERDLAAAAREAPVMAWAVPALLRQAALRWVHAGEAVAAEPVYEALYRQWPEDPAILNEWGAAAGARGALELAAERFQAALACDPAFAVARTNLARVVAMQAAE
ncbi:MAG: glycosyltransferase family 1 protein [Candidatus Sericytochromatia bacterium]|nr:glycosyltransferase family 1 protein [Candidatus Sericytochromatia bacterium]